MLTLIFALVAIAVLYLAKAVVVPLALAILFAFLLSPIVALLERIRFPRALAVFLVILVAGTAVGTAGWTVFKQLVDVTDHMSDYTYNIQQKIDILNRTQSTSFSRAEDELKRLSLQVSVLNWDIFGNREQPPRRVPGASSEHPLPVQEVSNSGRMGAIQGLLGAMVSIFLVVVFTFFMLLQREDLRNRLIRLTGRGHLSLMTQTMDEASSRVSRYIGLQLLVNVCYGVIVFLVLHFIGLPHAMLWGALACILRFVPYIGAPIAALLPMVFSLAVFHGWMPTLQIAALFFCMEILTANFIEPRLYGKQTGLSPLAILVAAVFWTLIWGPIGLILSVPLTVCLVVVGSHVPSLKFLTVLLGDQPVMRTEAHYYQRLLAGDEQEASQVLESYLKDKSVADLYDHVLIPALGLFEQDRHRNVLDNATARFVTDTTRELVEELGARDEGRNQSKDGAESGTNGIPHRIAGKNGEPTSPVNRRVACVAVRDDADEIVAMMLAQLLTRAGHSVGIILPGEGDAILEEVSRNRPDVVCLSALPPYAVAYVRRLYGKLSAQGDPMQIIIGLWKYTGDLDKVAEAMSGENENFLCTTLAQVVQRVTFPTSTGMPGEPHDTGIPAVHG